MRGKYRILKATLLGGAVVLLPLIVVAALAAWAIDTALQTIMPVFRWLPDQSVVGVSLTLACAVLALLVLCFLAGLLAETAIVRGVGSRAERLALSLPGYALMKNVGTSMVGMEGVSPVRTVEVRSETCSQLGFLMETLPDGRHVVFIPGVPRALVGSLLIVDADRVQILEMPVSKALDVLGRLGIGLRESYGASASATGFQSHHE